jgi:hypothetical protein
MPPLAIVAAAALAGGAAYGATKGARTSKQTTQYENFQKTRLPGASAQELADVQKLGDLSNSQLALLEQASQDLQNRSPYELSGSDQATFDQSWTGAMGRLRHEGNLYAQDLASTRGLNRSDTPVAEVALRQYGLALADMESNRARAQLDYGLQGNQYRLNAGLNLASALPPALQLSLLRNVNLRMAQPWTTGRGYANATSTMSPLQGISQGMGLASQFMGGVGGAMAGGAGGVGAAGMASGMQGMGSIAMPRSDVRLKRDIRPVAWQWKDGEPGEYLGIIAQEVEQSHPHLVTRGEDGYRRVDYGAMVAMLLDERQHLYAQLDRAKG